MNPIPTTMITMIMTATTTDPFPSPQPHKTPFGLRDSPPGGFWSLGRPGCLAEGVARHLEATITTVLLTPVSLLSLVPLVPSAIYWRFRCATPHASHHSAHHHHRHHQHQPQSLQTVPRPSISKVIPDEEVCMQRARILSYSIAAVLPHPPAPPTNPPAVHPI